MNKKVTVIIPAFNEEASIGKVIKDLPKELIQEVIVGNNGSTDQTQQKAENAGATVVLQKEKGYGAACLKAIEKAAENPPYILAFIDGDYSDYPEELEALIQPILNNESDFVLGARTLGTRERGALTPQQVFGNWLACFLMKFFYKHQYHDLGPFRAIKWEAYEALKMEDRNYGWTIEMQIKALQQKLRIKEIPVQYRNRIGTSKVSGTLKGSVLAGYKIIKTIFKYL